MAPATSFVSLGTSFPRTTTELLGFAQIEVDFSPAILDYDKVPFTMPAALTDSLGAIKSLPSDEIWGPPTSTESLVDGVPYAPYSKGDRLGRMADWTTEGKDRDARSRQQQSRYYKGRSPSKSATDRLVANTTFQTSRFMEPAHPPFSPSRWPKMNLLSP